MISIASSISWIVRLNILFISGCFHICKRLQHPLSYWLKSDDRLHSTESDSIENTCINDIRISYLVFQNHWYRLIMTHIGAKRKQSNMSVGFNRYIEKCFSVSRFSTTLSYHLEACSTIPR